MDIELKGRINNISVVRCEDKRDLVHFELHDGHLMQGLKCYMIPERKVADKIKKLNLEKVYILEGCLCVDADDKEVDFQVHKMYAEPDYIWG